MSEGWEAGKRQLAGGIQAVLVPFHVHRGSQEIIMCRICLSSGILGLLPQSVVWDRDETPTSEHF